MPQQDFDFDADTRISHWLGVLRRWRQRQRERAEIGLLSDADLLTTQRFDLRDGNR